MLPRHLPILVTLVQAGLPSAPDQEAGAGNWSPGQLCRRVFDFSHRVAGWLPALDSTDPGFLDAPLPSLAHDFSAARVYRAFHQAISDHGLSPDIRAGLDCRIWPTSALPAGGRANYPDWLLCLSNGGDIRGERIPGQAEVTCQPALLRNLRDLAAARLMNLPGEIRLNEPLAGSYLIHRHAGPDFPWIRMDFCCQAFFTPEGTLNEKRVAQVRAGLETMLALWCRIENW